MVDITVYYMYNGHGDVTALLNTAGDTVATYYYDIWGNILEKMESASVSNPFRYAGYQYDEETDLYYLNARYYDAKIARFLTEDTYTGRQNDPLSLNLYTYCMNNPIIYVDPTGNVPDQFVTADGNVNINSGKGTDKNYSVYNNGSGNQVNNDSTKNKNEAAKEKAAEKAKNAELVAKKNKEQKEIEEKAAKNNAIKASNVVLKEIAGGFKQGVGITLTAIAVPGNTIRSVCYDAGNGDFKNILPNALDSLTGKRQVSVLDLVLSKETQQDFYNYNETLYTFTNLVTGTFDPTILVGGSGVSSLGDDVLRNTMKNSADEVIESGSGSFRQLMSPDELARYDDYWNNIGYQRATEARDTLINNTVGSKQKATAIGAYDIKSGNVTASFAGEIPTSINQQLVDASETIGGIGSKGVNGKNTVGVCAEFQSANTLLNQGGILENMRFTDAVRPRTGQIIPTCTNCQNIFDILK